MDPIIVQLVGCAAAVTASCMFAPQALRAWQDRNDVHALDGVSIWTHVLLVLQASLWMFYNGSVGAWWGVVPNLFIIPLGLFILFVLWRAKRIRDEEQAGPS